MKTLVLDSNAVISLFDGDRRIADELSEAEQILVPAVVLAEVRLGINGTKMGRAMTKWLKIALMALTLGASAATFADDLFYIKGKEGTYYETFTAARTAATEGDTIVLAQDYDLGTSSTVAFAYKNNLTLDLGGHTLTADRVAGIQVDSVTATITNGTIDCGTGSARTASGGRNGAFQLSNGTLNIRATVSSGRSGTALCDCLGTVTVNVQGGADVTCAAGAFWTKYFDSDPVFALNVSGGSLSTTSDFYGLVYIHTSDVTANVTVSGGEVSSGKRLVYVYYDTYTKATTTNTVVNATFTGGTVDADENITFDSTYAVENVNVASMTEANCTTRFKATDHLNVASGYKAAKVDGWYRIVDESYSPVSTYDIPGDYDSIDAALADPDVKDGDTIRLAKGVHTFAHTTNSVLNIDVCATIGKGVKIVGSDNRADVVINCGGGGGFALTNSAAVLSGMTFSNFCSRVSSRPLHIASGTATNIAVVAKNSATGNNTVYVGSDGAFHGGWIGGLWANSWDSGVCCLGVYGGTVTHTTVDSCRNLYAPIQLGTGGGRRAQLVDCTFSKCSTRMCIVSAVSVDLSKCRLICNAHEWNQGAMLYSGRDCTFSDCIITGNYDSVNQSGSPLMSIGSKWCNSGDTFKNCLIAANTMYDSPVLYLSVAAGTKSVSFVNCTIYGNTSTAGSIAGVNASSESTAATKLNFVNTILKGNRNKNGEDAEFPETAMTKVTTSISNSCYYGAAADDSAGNFDSDPQFRDAAGGDYSLGDSSPCVDTGQEVAGLDHDIDGRTRPLDGTGAGVAKTDVGCYEHPANTIPLQCQLTVGSSRGIAPCSVELSATITGTDRVGLDYVWQAIRNAGGSVTTNALETSEPACTFENLAVGTYTFVLRVTSAAQSKATDEEADAFLAMPRTTYVSNSGSATWPYDSEFTATPDLGEAAALAGERVIVKPGYYDANTHATDPDNAYSVVAALTSGVSVEGPDDPGDATVDCGGLGGFSLSHDDARVSGLTLKNFLTAEGSGPALQVTRGMASNLVLVGSAPLTVASLPVVGVDWRGLAADIGVEDVVRDVSGSVPLVKASGGTLRGVACRRCRAASGLLMDAEMSSGGVRATVDGCEISDSTNTAGSVLLTKYSDVRKSLIARNRATNGWAAELLYSTAIDLSVTGNSVCGGIHGGESWGSDYTYLTNCLIADNRTTYYAPLSTMSKLSKFRVVNCTIAGNANSTKTSACGGGIGDNGNSASCRTTMDLVNCIVWGNTRGGQRCDVNLTSSSVDYTFNACDFSEAGSATGTSLLALDPLFRSGYELRAPSPCVNVGRNLGWEASATDLKGNPRLKFNRVDLGCYESPRKRQGITLIVR